MLAIFYACPNCVTPLSLNPSTGVISPDKPVPVFENPTPTMVINGQAEALDLQGSEGVHRLKTPLLLEHSQVLAVVGNQLGKLTAITAEPTLIHAQQCHLFVVEQEQWPEFQKQCYHQAIAQVMKLDSHDLFCHLKHAEHFVRLVPSTWITPQQRLSLCSMLTTWTKDAQGFERAQRRFALESRP